MKNDTVVLNKTKKEAKIYEKSMVFRRSTTLKIKAQHRNREKIQEWTVFQVNRFVQY